MIENDHQLEVAKYWIDRFRKAAASIDLLDPDVFELAIGDAYLFQAEELEEQVREYEEKTLTNE